MRDPLENNHGFTLIEVIAVLIILGIIAVVAVSQYRSPETSLYAETEVIKTHLRYAQTQAMNRTTLSLPVWGIRCDGTDYWLFEGTNPDSQIRVLPDNAAGGGNKLSLAAKQVGMSSFTVFFDGRGIPYSTYPASPLASDDELSIRVTPQGKSSPTANITITPLTGYIP